MNVEPKVLEEAEYEAWDRFVASCPTGSVYSCTKYLSIFTRIRDFRFRVIALIADGQYVGGIALVEQSTRWGRILEPRLLLQYNGFVIGDIESKYPSRRASKTIKISKELAACLEPQEYARVLLKCRWPLEDVRPFLARGWSATPTYTYVVPLFDIERQWKLVDRNLKRLIRRCQNDGLSVTVDDDFESFYRLHEETHDRKGAPIYLPIDKFADYFKKLQLNGLARLYHVRLKDGTSIAAQLVLAGDHPVCETVSACADGRYLKTGASAFLRWKSFEHLAAEGYTHNDLTDASLNSVTRFKSQFGGDLRVCFALAYPSTRRYRWGSRLGRVARAVLRR